MGLHSVLAFTIIVPVSIAGRELAVALFRSPSCLNRPNNGSLIVYVVVKLISSGYPSSDVPLVVPDMGDRHVIPHEM